MNEKQKRAAQKRFKQPKPSKRIETAYRISMRSYLDRINREISKSQEWNQVTENRITSLVRKVRGIIDSSLLSNGSATNLVKRFIKQGNDHNKKANQKAWKRAVGVSLARIMESEGIDKILQGKLAENVSLIKSVSNETLERTEDALWRQFNGTTNETLNQSLSSIYRNQDNRVKIIARDQTSKFNSALTRQRNLNLGVEDYFWDTSGDERVRDSHEANNGKLIRYDDPPKETGHPGDEVMCRCTERANIEKVLDRLGL